MIRQRAKNVQLADRADRYGPQAVVLNLMPSVIALALQLKGVIPEDQLIWNLIRRWDGATGTLRLAPEDDRPDFLPSNDLPF